MSDAEVSSVGGVARSRARLDQGRRLSDRLFSWVRPEAWLDRPIPDRNRVLFYLGHLEAFDWNQIGRAVAGRGVDDALDRLFAFGIDPPPGELPADSAEDWPALSQVRDYADAVRRRLDDVFDLAPQTAIDISIEHRLMHVETLTYLLHAMPYARRVVTPKAVPVGGCAPDHRRVEIPAGSATLGRARGTGFGWDNEFEEHAVWVERFAVDRYKVTNGRYLEFVESGGESPPFWIRSVDGWRWRGFDAEIPLPLERPVYATWDQASAFARWAGGSLPTEAQFHRYAFGTREGDERPHPWGSVLPSAERGAFDFTARDTISVLATPAGDSAFGVAQAVGNGWEWTCTPFAPFPGFSPMPTYLGYSSSFFDGQHYVLKGASCRTAQDLLRRSFRNWFRPAYRHAYTAFRVVWS